MIAHVVLYQPRPDLTAADRARLNDALTAALRAIPSIRRARVGSRVRHGAAYEARGHTAATVAQNRVALAHLLVEEPVEPQRGSAWLMRESVPAAGP